MKATCIECGEHNEWVSECPECNEMVCDECWPIHERDCKTFHSYISPFHSKAAIYIVSKG